MTSIKRQHLSSPNTHCEQIFPRIETFKIESNVCVNVNAIFERPILVFCLLFLESWRCGCRGAAAAGANSSGAAAATVAAAETKRGCLGRWWRSKLCRGKTTVFSSEMTKVKKVWRFFLWRWLISFGMYQPELRSFLVVSVRLCLRNSLRY